MNTELTYNPDGSTTERTSFSDGSTTERTSFPTGRAIERSVFPDGKTIERSYSPDGRMVERSFFSDGKTVERSYYPGGNIKGEVTLIGKRPHGKTRRWHPNGVLASEIPLDHGTIDGTVSQWYDTGKLIGSCEIKQGTGMYRLWHPNGNLMSEVSMIDGKYTGRQVAFFDDGEVAGEIYWLEDVKVSKKRYREACASNSSLPVYEPDGKVTARAARATRKKPKDMDHVETSPLIAQLLGGPHVREAMSWLTEKQEPSRSLGEASSQEESLRLVKKLYALGTIAVHAVEIDGNEDEDQNTGRIVIELPQDTKGRRNILRFCAALARMAGYDGEADTGQRHILLMLD